MGLRDIRKERRYRRRDASARRQFGAAGIRRLVGCSKRVAALPGFYLVSGSGAKLAGKQRDAGRNSHSRRGCSRSTVDSRRSRRRVARRTGPSASGARRGDRIFSRTPAGGSAQMGRHRHPSQRRQHDPELSFNPVRPLNHARPTLEGCVMGTLVPRPETEASNPIARAASLRELPESDTDGVVG